MHPQSHNNKIILASTSRYRKLLLERFPIRFETAAPDVDESALPGELAGNLVSRLAIAKARAVSVNFPAAIVIGSDQVAKCGGSIIGKPGTAERARAQLTGFSGKTVVFLTAFAVINEESGFRFERTVATEVEFRSLSPDEINRYVELDNPTDCAGSFKSEANGTALLCRMSSDDPTAIMGLPMISLAEGLREAGVQIP